MTRRLILLSSTFLALLLAFGIYRLIVGDASLFQRRSLPPAPAAPEAAASTRPGLDASEGLDLNIEARDDYGQLEAIYRAASWQRRKDGSVKLVEPRVIRFMPNNQQIHLYAAQGEIYAEGYGQRAGQRSSLPKKFRISRGRLSDGVHIDMDRSTLIEREELSARPQDLVQITTPDLDFDSELLHIGTDKEILVTSADADISGRGLSITWNEKPVELRNLTLAHGDQMVIKRGLEQFDAISIPGGQESSQYATAPSTPTGADAEPESRRIVATMQAQPNFPPATLPTTLASTRTTEIERVFGVKDAAFPTSMAISEPPPEPKSKQNVFRVNFNDDVKIVSSGLGTTGTGRREMTGAKVLSLWLNWDNKSKGSSSKSSRQTDSASPTSTSASEPTSKPARTMVVKWSGPLTIVPDGSTPVSSQNTYRVEAKGDKLVLSEFQPDSQSKATCQSFVFDSVQEFDSNKKPTQLVQKGRLEAGSLKKVVLETFKVEGTTLAPADRMECPLITFDRTSAKAQPVSEKVTLVGAGRMERYSQQGGMMSIMDGADFTGRKTLAATTQIEGPITPDWASWTKSVEVEFATSQPVQDGQASKGRRYAKSVTLLGDVEVHEGNSGNFISSQTLSTEFAMSAPNASPATQASASDGSPTKLAKTYPAKVTATGDVHAKQADRNADNDIRCESMEVHFEEKPVKAEDGTSRLRVRPIRFIADGKDKPVSIRSEERDQPNATIVEANHVKSNMGIKEAKAETVEVPSAGALSFITNRDLEGQELSKPLQVTMAWTRSMKYDGPQNNAKFFGEPKNPVVLTTGPDKIHPDTMKCQIMTVEFEDPKPATQPATDPTAQDPLYSQTATLTGTPGHPAKVTRGENWISGQEITMSGPERSKGGLLSMDSAALGAKRVSSTSAGATSRPSGKDNSLKRRISHIIADGGVQMDSASYDEQGHLTRRVRVLGQTLDHDASEATVEKLIDVDRDPATKDVPQGAITEMRGAGAMQVEDYRAPAPPKTRSGRDAAAVDDTADRPSQNVFAWEGNMRWLRKYRQVWATKNVTMKDRSGDQIVNAKGLQASTQFSLQPWGELKPGRRRDLHCEDLLAMFDEPVKDKANPQGKAPASAPAGVPEMGPNLGQIKLFIATQGVLLTDGPMQVMAQEVMYRVKAAASPNSPTGKQRDGVMDIWGYLKTDSTLTNAHLSYEDPANHRLQTFDRPYIHCQTVEVPGQQIRVTKVEVPADRPMR